MPVASGATSISFLDDPDVVRGTLMELSNRGVSRVKICYDDLYHQVTSMAPQLAQTIIQICRELNLTSYAHVYSADDTKLLLGYGPQLRSTRRQHTREQPGWSKPGI